MNSITLQSFEDELDKIAAVDDQQRMRARSALRRYVSPNRTIAMRVPRFSRIRVGAQQNAAERHGAALGGVGGALAGAAGGARLGKSLGGIRGTAVAGLAGLAGGAMGALGGGKAADLTSKSRFKQRHADRAAKVKGQLTSLRARMAARAGAA